MLRPQPYQLVSISETSFLNRRRHESVMRVELHDGVPRDHRDGLRRREGALEVATRRIVLHDHGMHRRLAPHGYGQAKQRVIHPGDLARESDHIAAQTPHDGAPVVLHCPCRRRHGRESASLSPRQRQTHRDILLLQVQLHSGRDGILDEAAHEVERVSPPQVAVKPRIPPQNSADLATDATRARQTLGVQEAQHQDEWSGAERERKVHSLAALHAKIEGGVGQSEAVPGVAEPSERKRRHVHSKEL
mmetsp:Transcript_14522/g.54868  ORF Transcript_14522/g.54868 Transcript_14522/m.54868 type:complete len:247 (+) Transcript_14522:182-922(+)